MNPVTYEDLTIKLPDLRVYYKRVERHITFVELRILMILLAEPTVVITAEELVRRAGLTNKASLCKYISTLRSIFDQRYIHTIHGTGYSFIDPKAG